MVNFTKASVNQYWIEAEEDDETRLIFYSYGKAIFFFSLESRELVFIRSGWTATTARHARLALAQWSERYDRDLTSAIRDLIESKKVRNFKAFMEGTDSLRLGSEGGYTYYPVRWGSFLKGYFE